MDMNVCQLFTLLCFCIAYLSAQNQEVSLVSCVRGSTDTEIIATIRAKINGADVTELTAHDDAGNPQTDAACTTNTITNDFLQLTLTFDENSPTCGIVAVVTQRRKKRGENMGRFDIIVHAKGSVLDQPYHLYCHSAMLAESMLFTGGVLVHGHIGQFNLPGRVHDVIMQAAFVGSDVPVIETELGREIYVRIIFDRGTGNIASTNWGKKFHVGFLKTDPAATLSLDIYAPAHGSRVSVKGMLAGSLIDETLPLSRDSPVSVSIATEYQPSSVVGTWNTEDKGLEIAVVGDDGPIAIRVNSDNGAGFTDSYVAYPDEVLTGTLYRLPTLPITGMMQAQAVIVATEDGTSLTITRYSGPVAFPGGEGTLNVALDNFQTYHMFCDVGCEGASFVTDKPVAVITGNGQGTLAPGTLPGHVMSPILPAANFGRKFVLINVRSGLTTESQYKILYEAPEFATQTNWLHASGPTMLHDGDDAICIVAPGTDTYAAEEFEVDPAANGGNPPYASVTQFLTGTDMMEPAMVSLPPVELWSTEQVIPVKSGVDYDIVVVSTKDDVGAITFSTNAEAEQLLADFADETDVTPHSGAPVKYAMLTVTFEIDPADKWMKFSTPDKTKPFMVLAYELLGSGSVQALGPFGQRASAVAGCAPTAAQVPGLPVYPGMRAGDGIDNDCDGQIDEEIMNGENDDGDTVVDEDLAPGDAGPIKAVYNFGLEMAEDEPFTTPETLIDTNGCNADADDNAISTIGHFTVSTEDNMKYPDYWTLRTKNFPAFRITNKEPLWLRGKVGFCDDESGLCLNSCNTGRKRRDVDNTREPETIYLQLKIKDSERNETETVSEIDSSSCSHDALFWSMVTLLLVINLSEVGLITVFTTKRIQLDK